MENEFYYKDNVRYLPIDYQYVFQEKLTDANQVRRNGRVSLDGAKPFLLRYMKREVISNTTGLPLPNVRFAFLLRNSRGDFQYSSGGIGSTQDRVIDSCYFGNAQFPFVLQPPIWFEANATIQFEIEDLGQATATPYIIHFVFGGQLMQKV